jgi:hypothetical protein
MQVIFREISDDGKAAAAILLQLQLPLDAGAA